MKTTFIRVLWVVLLFTAMLSSKVYAQYQYPFQNPVLI